MGRLKDERIDWSGCFEHVHNESNKLPNHEGRMKAHCERVKKEEKIARKKQKKRKKRKKK